MPRLEFRDLSFEDMDGKVKVNFLKLFYLYLDKSNLKRIAPFRAAGNSISFEGISEETAERKFNQLLLRGFNGLKSRLTNKSAVYIHRNSGIPLIGSLYFGIIDRNTNIVEIRPITGCNLLCAYCSVDQSRRNVDFVVEKDYIIEEFRKLAELKGDDDIEAHIGAQGEPLLYAELADLIRDLRKIKQVKRVSIDTNGTLLSKKMVDELIKAGLTQFNISLNALDEGLANRIACTPYPLRNVIETCRYIAGKADLVIAPVWLQGINDDEMPKFIKFVKGLQNRKHKAILAIQNFLEYRLGRNPVKQMSWDLFRQRMHALEEKYKARLILDFKRDFKVHETRHLENPFKKGQVVKARIVCLGHLRNEMIAAACGRTIAAARCSAGIGKETRLRITRTKHNIFYGVAIK